MRSDIERQAQEIRDLFAAGDLDGASVSAFRWARALAMAVARPLAVDVQSGRHVVRYWVVAVDWYDWSGGGEIEPRSAHLARAWVAPGGIDYRRAGLVGTHPQMAEPQVTSREEIELVLLGTTHLERIVTETDGVEQAVRSA